MLQKKSPTLMMNEPLKLIDYVVAAHSLQMAPEDNADVWGI